MAELGSRLSAARDSVAAEIEALEREIAGARRQLQASEARRDRLRRLLNDIDHVDDPPELPFEPALPARVVASTVAISPPVVTSTTAGQTVVRPSIALSRPPQTLRQVAERVLEDAGKPMKVRDLIAGIQARGIKADREYESVRASLVSLLHTLIKKGDTFTQEGPGEYGLVRWKMSAA